MTDETTELTITRYFLDGHGQLYSISIAIPVRKDESLAQWQPYDQGLVKRGLQLYQGASLYIPSINSANQSGELETEVYRAVALQRTPKGNRLCFYVDNNEMHFASKAKLWLDDKPHIHAAVKMFEDLTGVFLATITIGSAELPCLSVGGQDVLSVDQPPKVNDWDHPPDGVVMLPQPIAITWRKKRRIDKKTGKQQEYNGTLLWYFNIHLDGDKPIIQLADGTDKGNGIP